MRGVKEMMRIVMTVYLSLVSRLRIPGALPPSTLLYGVVLKQIKSFTCYVMWLLFVFV